MLKVSVIVPTRNEYENIALLLRGIATSMVGIEHEVLVVDDSDDDKTATLALKKGAIVEYGQHKGLGQAIIDGINASKNEVILVMDADGSHQPKEIPSLLKPILEKGYDIVIGSRYVKGADYSNWAFNRKIKSLVGVKLMQLVTGVRDSNSGFFALHKSIVDTSKLNGKTWKIMLEVLFKGNWISKLEVPIKFEDRKSGESKRSNRQVFKDAINIIKLVAYKMRRFISFALVGGTGNIWHFGLLYALTEWGHFYYMWSGVVAVIIAGTSNYILNHYITFRKEKDGNKSLWRGWLKYETGNGVGDAIQLGLMFLFTQVFGIWYMLSAVIATGVTVIFKFSFLKSWVWGKPKRKASDADYEWFSYYKGLPWQKRWKRIIASIVKEFAEYPDGDAGMMLEVGCGSSPSALFINHSDYIGIDPNMAKVQYMDAKNLRNVRYYGGDLDTITFTDKFDTILFVEVIEHLSDIEEAKWNLRMMHKLLKPNGKLVIATPNFGGFMGKAMDTLYGIFQKGAYKEEHRLKFDLSSLKELCQECGLKYVDSKIPSGADMVCLFRKSDAKIQQ